MAKTIFIIVLLVMVGSIFGSYVIDGNLWYYFTTYVVTPLGNFVKPVARVFEVFLSFSSLRLVFSLILICTFVVFIINRFRGE
ncbi:MAG: hypothetical protein ACI4M5_06165 [Christensenellales bacterium]